MTPMKKLRLAAKMTQYQCAVEYARLTRTKPNQGRWGRLERGEIDLNRADYRTVLRIAQVLGCQPHEILPRTRKKTKA